MSASPGVVKRPSGKHWVELVLRELDHPGGVSKPSGTVPLNDGCPTLERRPRSAFPDDSDALFPAVAGTKSQILNPSFVRPCTISARSQSGYLPRPDQSCPLGPLNLAG